MGPPEHPAIPIFFSWGCAALAYDAYPLATRGGHAGAVAAAFVFGLPVLFLAYWLGAGTLAFVVDARRSCLPGSQRLARRAKCLASVLLLPALALPVAALAGSPLWGAWVPTVLVLAIALGEILAPLLPISSVGLCLLSVLAAYWMASGRTDHERGMSLFFALLSAALALLALARWRRVLRQGSRPPSLAGRLRTICIRISQRGALARAPWGAVSGHGSWERQPPVQIVRTCLGGMFVQLSTRQLIIGAALLALFIVTAIGLPWLGASGRRWAVGTFTIAAAAWVSSGFRIQILKLTRAQIAELALMPGLGAPAAQRRTLCSAVLLPALLWLSIVLLLGSACLLLNAEPLSSVGVLAVFILIIWVTYTVRALRKPATFPQRRPSLMSEFLLDFWAYWLYLELSILQNGHGFWLLWHWFWWQLITVGVLVSLLFAIVVGFCVRRFATAPHPFLS
jgi:hypothetical protein